uniref:Uncharacterized protein n=1 Tax=Varanus komodoensis TaxID=61221 RepID=A0A8D2IX00_VARKO
MSPAKGQRRLSLCPGGPGAPIAFGDLLEEVGNMGLFQLFSLLLLCLPVLLLASHNLVQNFSAATPGHRCHEPAAANASQHGQATPLGQALRPESCRRLALRAASGPNGSLEEDGSAATEPCRDGWEYDHSTFRSTIVTEWDLVCDLQPLKSLAQSLFMAGVLVGAFVFGDLSDRYGRRLVLIWSLLLIAVMGTAAAFSTNFVTYCIFRLLSGVGISGFLLNYVCLSKCPPRQGPCAASSTAGQVLLAGLAYGIRDWRWLQLAISAPFFSLLWLPPAPPPPALSSLILRSFSMNMAYFGLSMDLSVFGLDLFLVQLFFGAIDLVAKMACALLLNFFGRRTIQAVSLILAGAFLLLSLPIPAGKTQRLREGHPGSGRRSISARTARSGGVWKREGGKAGGRAGLVGHFVTIMARLGGIVAPVVLMAGDYHRFLPLVIFGVSPILSGVSAAFLPEMFNVPLLDTIEEFTLRALPSVVFNQSHASLFSILPS